LEGGVILSLSYHFTFTAPKTVSAAELEHFLKQVEHEAKSMGFNPTLVLSASFKTSEQRKCVRRLTTGIWVEDERLKGVTLLDREKVWSYDREHGSCRVIPEHGVVLVVTDERGCETVFGFMFYPDQLADVNGKVLAEMPTKGRWFHRDFVDSPDTRFRKIVRKFAEAGFVEEEHDEFTSD
jgi:hypothetical protein